VRFTRAELASQLRQRLGLELVAKSSWFEVVGIPQSLLDAGSSRRKEILAELEKSGFTGPKAAKIAARDTREAKTVVPARNSLSAGAGRGRSRFRLRPGAGIDSTRITQIPAAVPAGIVADGINKLLERQSFFSERELTRAVAEQTQPLGVPVDALWGRARSARAARASGRTSVGASLHNSGHARTRKKNSSPRR